MVCMAQLQSQIKNIHVCMLIMIKLQYSDIISSFSVIDTVESININLEELKLKSTLGHFNYIRYYNYACADGE